MLSLPENVDQYNVEDPTWMGECTSGVEQG